LQFYIGCSGWSYSAWQGPFYPSDIDNNSNWLSYYASVFDYVESDPSFYKAPNVFTVYTQQTLTKNNYAFRDYFQGAIKRNDTNLGNVIIATAASHPREAVIAVPVYSLKDNSTIVGVWAGSIDFNILDKELQSLNITSSSDVGGNGNNNTRIVYLDSKGQKIADSDINKSSESFANLNSVKNAINGQAGSITDIVDNNTKMLVTYSKQCSCRVSLYQICC
jgi:hypothetical protein